MRLTGRLAVAGAILALFVTGCDSTPRPSTGPGPAGTPSDGGPTSPPDGSSEPSGSAGPVAIQEMPACQLVFAAEAATAIGVPIAEAFEQQMSPPENGWLVDCLYLGTAGSLNQASLELTVGAGTTAIDQFNALKGATGVTSRAGLGDEALLRATTFPGLDGPVVSLFVRVGDAVIAVSLGIVGLSDDGALLLAGDAATQERIADAIATIALGRLTTAPVVGTRTCDLLTQAEASAITGASYESAADGDLHDVWGPTCTYTARAHPDLFVSVNGTAAAQGQFGSCSSDGEVVPGLGDAATYPRPGPALCEPALDGTFFVEPLLVRAGDVIVTVAARPDGVTDTPGSAWHERAEAIARHILAKLGVAPGPTAPPFTGSSLEHPCALASEAEVATIIGTAPAGHSESAADSDGNNASCYYWIDNGVIPLTLILGHGSEAQQAFAEVKQDSRYVATAGIGDEAYTIEADDAADKPLLSIEIRVGASVLSLSLGGIGKTQDGTLMAPGDVQAQTTMLRQLADLILPRLGGQG
jgi:hypothetical protein